tara:strand:- start:1270 stop:1785 length:516 start_codon:yes stop_codon:yes gene_type:complete
MFEDTIHTKRLSDKLKIWYGPTNWRPDDVIERNPSSGNLVFDDKFDPQLSVHQRVYAVAQLFSVVIFAGILASTISLQTYQETATFGVILILAVLLTSLILENKSYAFHSQLVISSVLILLIYHGHVASEELLATQFLELHAMANLTFIIVIMIAKRFGINGKYDKALQQD